MRMQAAKRSAVFRRMMSMCWSSRTARSASRSISSTWPSIMRRVTSERRRRIPRLSWVRAMAMDFV
jgi:hypothetical protein